MYRRLDIGDEYYLSEITAGDGPWYAKHLNDPAIHETTLRIPYPYTEKDAHSFIQMVRMQELVTKKQMHWAIRNKAGEVIGGIGLHGKYPEMPHRDEIGYWVAKSYWGKGIMNRAVRALCEFLIEEYHLTRIEAPIFEFNTASCRVAEKCGFRLEGVLRKAYFKNGKYSDGKLYALVK
jgi:ribosomal-protein-alanine N-acetyltransferase